MDVKGGMWAGVDVEGKGRSRGSRCERGGLGVDRGLVVNVEG